MIKKHITSYNLEQNIIIKKNLQSINQKYARENTESCQQLTLYWRREMEGVYLLRDFSLV